MFKNKNRNMLSGKGVDGLTINPDLINDVLEKVNDNILIEKQKINPNLLSLINGIKNNSISYIKINKNIKEKIINEGIKKGFDNEYITNYFSGKGVNFLDIQNNIKVKYINEYDIFRLITLNHENIFIDINNEMFELLINNIPKELILTGKNALSFHLKMKFDKIKDSIESLKSNYKSNDEIEIFEEELNKFKKELK